MLLGSLSLVAWASGCAAESAPDGDSQIEGEPAALVESDAEQSDEPTVQWFASSTVNPASLIANIKAVKYSGDLCPSGTLFPALNKSFATIKSEAMFSVQNATRSASCSLSVDIQVPAGYQFSTPLVSWSTLAFVSEDGSIKLRASYAFEGGSGSGSNHQWSLKSDKESVATARPNLWSPSCAQTSQAQTVRLKLGLTATIAAPTDRLELQVPTIDIDLSSQMGTSWRKCGSTTTL